MDPAPNTVGWYNSSDVQCLRDADQHHPDREWQAQAVAEGLNMSVLQVAGQAAPATLKSAFLDPVADSMSTEVAMQLFAKTDAEFMTMFTGIHSPLLAGRPGSTTSNMAAGLQHLHGNAVRVQALVGSWVAFASMQYLTNCLPAVPMLLFAAAGALAALQSKRDSLHRRCEGLLKCKNEFAELARAL